MDERCTRVCCDRQVRAVTLSLGVTVRDSSRKTLVLQGLAMRNLGKSWGTVYEEWRAEGNLSVSQETRV